MASGRTAVGWEEAEGRIDGDGRCGGRGQGEGMVGRLVWVQRKMVLNASFGSRVPLSQTVYCLMEARPLNSNELVPLVDRDAPVATSLNAKVHCLLPCALHA